MLLVFGIATRLASYDLALVSYFPTFAYSEAKKRELASGDRILEKNSDSRRDGYMILHLILSVGSHLYPSQISIIHFFGV